MVLVLALILAGLQPFGDIRHRTAGRSRWYGRPIADPQDNLRGARSRTADHGPAMHRRFPAAGSVGTQREWLHVLFQGWPVEKIDPILCDRIDVDDLLWRTTQAIEDCLANLPGAED